ncbi:MAG: molybdenum cofactor guanylyltransferase [Bacteroidota bacterium]
MKNRDRIANYASSDAPLEPKAIKGLVLAGGSASRMGRDKGDLIYYTQPQKYRTAALLMHLGLDTYISQRETQKRRRQFQYIIDQYENIGPMAGVLSAFEQHQTAWLVVACDYPLIKTKHLDYLLSQRDNTKIATVFIDEASGFFLPTIAIYETEFFPLLRESIARKNHSFQKLLQSNAVKALKTQDRAFRSIDTPAAYTAIKKEIYECNFRNS